MLSMKKHCNTCRHSYMVVEPNAYLPEGVQMQHCRSPQYNSPDYTQEMRMEDWPLGYCRFWEAKEN